MSTLNELTLLEAIEGLKNGDFTSVELTTACLDQIEKQDEKFKVFITVTRDAVLKSAKETDELISRNGKSAFDRKRLLGIPFACKDNFSTKGVLTTSGSKMLDNYVPPFESTVTKKLNEAGALMLGKVNMDAFAHGSSTETSDFFATSNPWDLDKVAGGSSGGSAAAVALNMCIFATGSETGGSIRGPAAWCGVTGLKPSYGRVSRYGITAMASSTDSPGPITKTVEDAALVLEIVAGKDPLDATTSPNPTEKYLEKAQAYSLKGVKIGKPKSYFEIDLESGVKQKVEEVLKELEKCGAEIVEIDLLDPKYSIAVYTILQRSEVSSNLGRLDGIRYGNDRTNFGHEAVKRIMLGTYSLSAGYYDEYYGKAQKVRTLVLEDYARVFKDVDLIIGPTMPTVATTIGEIDKSSMFGEMMDLLNEPSCIAGLPGITIPCGFSNDLPVGVQLVGPVFSESSVLGAANEYQKVTNFHKEKSKI